METFNAEPYGLLHGDAIITRVSAKNFSGFSTPSVPNKPLVKVYLKPATPEMPDLELESEESFVLSWNSIDRSDKTEISQDGLVIFSTEEDKSTVQKVDER